MAGRSKPACRFGHSKQSEWRQRRPVSDLLAAEGAPPDPLKVGEIAARFGLELDLASIPRLTAEHGLTFGRDSN